MLKENKSDEIEQSTLLNWKYGDDLQVPIRVCLTGKTNSGKTYFARWLLYLLADKIDELYILCPTMDPNSWKDLTTAKHIYSDYNVNIIQDIIDNQRKLKEKGRPMKQVMILLDDCVFNFKKEDKVLSALFIKGRHYNISVMIISQKFRLLNNVIRSNVELVIVAKVVNQKEKDAIFQEYSTQGSKNEFIQLITDTTKDKGVLIIDMNSDEDNILHKSKAPAKLPKFYIEPETQNKIKLTTNNNKKDVTPQ